MSGGFACRSRVASSIETTTGASRIRPDQLMHLGVRRVPKFYFFVDHRNQNTHCRPSPHVDFAVGYSQRRSIGPADMGQICKPKLDVKRQPELLGTQVLPLS